MSQIHYLPLTPGFFAILVGIFVIVLILRSVRYAYESIGVLLFAKLVGSIFNIPVAELPPERIVSHENTAGSMATTIFRMTSSIGN